MWFFPFNFGYDNDLSGSSTSSGFVIRLPLNGTSVSFQTQNFRPNADDQKDKIAMTVVMIIFAILLVPLLGFLISSLDSGFSLVKLIWIMITMPIFFASLQTIGALSALFLKKEKMQVAKRMVKS